MHAWGEAHGSGHSLLRPWCVAAILGVTVPGLAFGPCDDARMIEDWRSLTHALSQTVARHSPSRV